VPSWELQDAEQRSAVLETQDVIRQLASGNVGVYAKVRQVGEAKWREIPQVPEFYTLCPWVNPKFASNDKVLSLIGHVSIGNDLQRLVGDSARVRASQDFYIKTGFHAPIFDAQFPGLASVTGKIHRLWDDFWVGALVSPPRLSIEDVGRPFVLYLFAINADRKRREHELHAYDYPIPDDQMVNLSFSVPAGGVALHKVRVPVSRDKGAGVHVLTLRNVSTSDKIAKGALVGALTLGSVIYKQGHRSFGVSLQVLSGPATTAPPAPVEQGKVCVKCGRMNSSASRFCENCGNALG
jgi:hypothetical protein